MATHRERILKALRGEMVDVIPFVPRLDLWWLGNVSRGTMPEKYQGKMPDEISRIEGWPVYHMVPNFADVSGPQDVLHRSIGLFNFKQSAYGWKFTDKIEVKVQDHDGQQIVEYHTPVGVARIVGGLTEQMKRAGSSLGWVQEHIIKSPGDYRIVASIFENIDVFPQYDKCREYMDRVGDDGVAAAGGPTLGASPMHLIQKEFIDTTKFFYEYKDHYREMRELADIIEVYFDRVLDIVANSPAEVVLWGANYDDMLTYPPYFEKEISPWLKKASSALGAKGKIMATHTDGENFGLMDLIRDCGVHVAESVTPYPMTKVSIEEYYRRWRGSLTLMGGIPESMLLEASTGRDEFETYLDNLFTSISPGDRIVLGTADSTPPDADFDRLFRINERVQKEGRLPLAGPKRRISRGPAASRASKVENREDADTSFGDIKQLVIDGDDDALIKLVENRLVGGDGASDILNRGLIPAMDRVGTLFKNGETFIPQVLLSARAMNGAMAILEPHLADKGAVKASRVLIGTVQGDMHDIGKNMVAIMLRGAGFEVNDVGINISNAEFVRQAEEYRPDIIALSSLLTTTMPEMKNVIILLEEKGLRKKVKVMVGGAPVNEKFAADIGADGYAPDAVEAVTCAKRLTSY